MEETTITNQHQLKEEINKQYPIDDKKPDTHTKIYAIHTILYAIVSVWLRFFKDKDISILFASLREKNKVDFDYIKTLLNQFKEYAAETVAKSAASASDLATDSAASAAKHPASVDAAVIAAKKAAESVAYFAKDSAAFFAVWYANDAYESARKYASSYSVEAMVNLDDSSCFASALDFSTKSGAIKNAVTSDANDTDSTLTASHALLYLISAYIYFKL